MDSTWRWAVVGGIAYALTWFGTEEFVEWLFADSSSRSAYGTISALWAVLYLSYVFDLGWRSSFSAVLLHILLGFVSPPPKSILTEMSFLDIVSPFGLLFFAGMTAAFLSPLFISVMVRYGKERLMDRFRVGA